MFLQYDIDLEDLKQNWALGGFNDSEQVKAQGQAAYIEGLYEMLKSLGARDED